MMEMNSYGTETASIPILGGTQDPVRDLAPVLPRSGVEQGIAPPETKKGYSPIQRTVFISLILLFCTENLAFFLPSPFLPVEAEAKGLSNAQVGFILGAFPLCSFVGSIFMGKVLSTGRRLGRPRERTVLFIGVLIQSVAYLSFSGLVFINDSNTFLALAMSIESVIGIACAGTQCSALVLVAEFFPDTAGLIRGTLEIMTGVGVVLGPLIGGTLFQFGGFALPFLVMTGLFAISIVLLSLTVFRSSPQFTFVANPLDERTELDIDEDEDPFRVSKRAQKRRKQFRDTIAIEYNTRRAQEGSTLEPTKSSVPGATIESLPLHSNSHVDYTDTHDTEGLLSDTEMDDEADEDEEIALIRQTSDSPPIIRREDAGIQSAAESTKNRTRAHIVFEPGLESLASRSQATAPVHYGFSSHADRQCESAIYPASVAWDRRIDASERSRRIDDRRFTNLANLTASVAFDPDPESPQTLSLCSLLANMWVVSAAFSVFTSMVVLSFLSATLSPELMSKFGSDGLERGWMFGIGATCYLIGSPLFGLLTDKNGPVVRRLVFITGLLLTVVTMICIGPSPYLPFLPETKGFMIWSMCLLGISGSMAFVAPFTEILSHCGGEGNSHLASVIVNAAQPLGSLVGSSTSGILVDAFGFAKAASFDAMIVLSAVVIMMAGVALQSFLCTPRSVDEEEESFPQPNEALSLEDEIAPLLGGQHSNRTPCVN